MNKRSSGIILHISSLPGKYGIGTLGEEAFRFVDFLKEAGQTYWQILPLGPTGFGNSPYQSFSAAAGNPYFIDFDDLLSIGLLEKNDYEGILFAETPDFVDFGRLYELRYPVLRKAYENAKGRFAKELSAFEKENGEWLTDYCMFMAVKAHFDMRPLSEWPDRDIARRKPEAMEQYRKLLAEEIGFYAFMQFIFFRQWDSLKTYAGKQGIKIIGDLPIYVSADSAEVWSKPELFKLSANGRLKCVAGVPPDLYSETGQLWGNPIYSWQHHEKTGYEWWIWRIKRSMKLFDVLRIDHFRGFANYWEVPADAETAIDGKWVTGPGMKLIEAIRKAVPDVSIIAEDLGCLDEKAVKFFDQAGYPGMKVLVYAFDTSQESIYLPHNCPPNSITYTSTHDSPTFVDWYQHDLFRDSLDYARVYMRLYDNEGVNWGAIKTAWGSPSLVAMTQFQDVLGLGEDARMNLPGTLEKNWEWRVRAQAINSDVAAQMHNITKWYWRLPSQCSISEV